jgi:hypothetical protein
LSADLQRQVGTGQTGGGIVGERGGEPPLGQSVAAAAAQMMASALGGNQQQVKLWFEVAVCSKVWSIEYL